MIILFFICRDIKATETDSTSDSSSDIAIRDTDNERETAGDIKGESDSNNIETIKTEDQQPGSNDSASTNDSKNELIYDIDSNDPTISSTSLSTGVLLNRIKTENDSKPSQTSTLTCLTTTFSEEVGSSENDLQTSSKLGWTPLRLVRRKRSANTSKTDVHYSSSLNKLSSVSSSPNVLSSTLNPQKPSQTVENINGKHLGAKSGIDICNNYPVVKTINSTSATKNNNELKSLQPLCPKESILRHHESSKHTYRTLCLTPPPEPINNANKYDMANGAISEYAERNKGDLFSQHIFHIHIF